MYFCFQILVNKFWKEKLIPIRSPHLIFAMEPITSVSHLLLLSFKKKNYFSPYHVFIFAFKNQKNRTNKKQSKWVLFSLSKFSLNWPKVQEAWSKPGFKRGSNIPENLSNYPSLGFFGTHSLFWVPK